MVLPLVPVTPISRSRRDGSPYTQQAISPSRAARVGQHEDRHPAGRGPGPAVRVGQHRDRAGGDRIGAERRPVHARPGQGHVQVAGRTARESRVTPGTQPSSFGPNEFPAEASLTPSSELSADSGRAVGCAGRIATG